MTSPTGPNSVSLSEVEVLTDPDYDQIIEMLEDLNERFEKLTEAVATLPEKIMELIGAVFAV